MQAFKKFLFACCAAVCVHLSPDNSTARVVVYVLAVYGAIKLYDVWKEGAEE